MRSRRVYCPLILLSQRVLFIPEKISLEVSVLNLATGFGPSIRVLSYESKILVLRSMTPVPPMDPRLFDNIETGLTTPVFFYIFFYSTSTLAFLTGLISSIVSLILSFRSYFFIAGCVSRIFWILASRALTSVLNHSLRSSWSTKNGCFP